MVHININLEKVINVVTNYGMKILPPAIIAFAGYYFIKSVVKVVEKILEKNKIDNSLNTFVLSMVNIVLRIVLFLIVVSMLGIQMTSFVALMGAAGLAIGLAFQGSLSNFAAGVMIVIFRPFNVGDIIESQTLKGKVLELQLFYTIIQMENNKKAVIPNGAIYSNIIAVEIAKNS